MGRGVRFNSIDDIPAHIRERMDPAELARLRGQGQPQFAAPRAPKAGQAMVQARTEYRQVVVTIPLRTGLGRNEREHHMAAHRRDKAEKATVRACLPPYKPAPPCTVHIVRLTPHTPKADDDNVSAGLKATRDQVAEWLGVDDGDGRVSWTYGQEQADGWGVRVEVAGG